MFHLNKVLIGFSAFLDTIQMCDFQCPQGDVHGKVVGQDQFLSSKAMIYFKGLMTKISVSNKTVYWDQYCKAFMPSRNPLLRQNSFTELGPDLLWKRTSSWASGRASCRCWTTPSRDFHVGNAQSSRPRLFADWRAL